MVQKKLQHKIKERKKKSILCGLFDEDDPDIALLEELTDRDHYLLNSKPATELSTTQYLLIKNHPFRNSETKKFQQIKINKIRKNEGIMIIDYKQKVVVGKGPVETADLFRSRQQRTCFGVVVITKSGTKYKNKKESNNKNEIIVYRTNHYRQTCLMFQ